VSYGGGVENANHGASLAADAGAEYGALPAIDRQSCTRLLEPLLSLLCAPAGV